MGESILLTGGSGLIGRPLVRKLLDCGYSVTVLSRNPLLQMPGGMRIAVGDLADVGTLRRAAAGCTIAIHAAGEVFDQSRMDVTNVEGTQNLLEAISVNVRHMVLVSSIGVIGAAAGVVTESDPCSPTNHYERTKLEAENAAREWSRREGRALTVLRPTNVFGERRRAHPRDSMRELLRAIARGRFAYVGRRSMANYVYSGDVAHACAFVIGVGATGVFHVNDACRLEEFVRAAALALGVREPSVHLPYFVARVIAASLTAAATVMRMESPLTRSRVDALANRTVYPTDCLRGLGWAPSFGYADGLRRTVAHYRTLGSLP